MVGGANGDRVGTGEVGLMSKYFVRMKISCRGTYYKHMTVLFTFRSRGL